MAPIVNRDAPTIALIARYPVPGMAKTRLIPALGKAGAARLHRHLVERTLDTIRESGLSFAVHVTGAPLQDFADWLGADVDLVPQATGGLGERLARVPAPAILLGADIPGLSAEHLRSAARAVQQGDVVIGPAADGGYYLLGYGEPVPFVLCDMPWGTDAVYALTCARLRARSIEPVVLEELADCDRPEDLALWPELVP